FTTAPTNEVAYIGSSVTIRSAASGTGALTYQWRKNGVDISGATQASLTLPSVRSSDAGEYAVWATDTSGSTASRTVQLTVQAPLPPVIVSQPVDTAVFIGSVLRLHATITATPQATLQWYRNGQAVAGATGASLSLTNFTSAMAGSYHLVATNAGGTARSRTVLVSVASPYSGVYFGTFTTGSGTVGRWGMQVIGQS